MGLAALGGLHGGELIMADPGRVGAALQEQLGGLAPAAMRGAPQRVVEVLARARRALWCEFVADAVGEAERGRLPQVRVRAAFQQEWSKRK